jgi:hypothetical protein
MSEEESTSTGHWLGKDFTFPLRIRVKISWGEEGMKRWKAGITPNAKPPSYKYIDVTEGMFLYYAKWDTAAVKAGIAAQKSRKYYK